MRRLLIALPIALMLAVPAQAARPEPGIWKAGKNRLGHSMTFKVKGSKITNVVASVLENCSGSSTSTRPSSVPV